MLTINNLHTQPSSRYDAHDPEQDGNKNTRFADVIIDGKSLYQRLKKYDMVPSLGWGVEEYQKLLIQYFLLEKPHPQMYYRYPILVCPWCGDEECGYISVKIDREGDLVIWKDFRLEPDMQEINVGPFYFEWEHYQKVILDTLGMGDNQ